MNVRADSTAPVVSISLPCYNAEGTLHDTLRSIWAQTFTDWELLAVDDGSTDRTLEMMRAIRDPRVRVFADGRNSGRPTRLNEAAATARGRYLARLDADDLMFPERLARQVAFLDSHPDVDLVGAGVVSLDMANCPLGRRQAPAVVNRPLQILAGEVFYHPTVTGRTEWFRQHPYSPDYLCSDDFALWARNASTLNGANLPEPLLFYREHGLFTHEKFCGRVADMRRALRAFGPPAVGRLLTRLLLARRAAKNAVYHGLHLLRLWHLTLKLSNRPLALAERAEFESVLAGIGGVSVPGLS